MLPRLAKTAWNKKSIVEDRGHYKGKTNEKNTFANHEDQMNITDAARGSPSLQISTEHQGTNKRKKCENKCLPKFSARHCMPAIVDNGAILRQHREDLGAVWSL